MPSPGKTRDVDSPWGQLSFEATRRSPAAAEGAAPASGHDEGRASPALTSNGRKRASRAAQFMPFAALTGYYELIREQELLAQKRAEGDRERWEETP